jgi:hypothetical protein
MSRLYTLTAIEDPNGPDQKTQLNCIFDGPPTERALLKMIKPLTNLDPITAEEFYELRQRDSRMVFSMNGSFGLKLEETTLIDCMSGDIKVVSETR